MTKKTIHLIKERLIFLMIIFVKQLCHELNGSNYYDTYFIFLLFGEDCRGSLAQFGH